MDAHPDNFEPVVSAHSRLKLILAHAGLGAEARTVALAQRYPNVYADTSAWFDQRLTPTSWHNVNDPTLRKGQAYSLSDAADVFRAIGIDRVLFGTNYAIRFPAPTLESVRGMPLTAAEHEQIFRANYRTVFDDWS
jgi:predicted TIM-barrel fold metal-dependent hydrolase